MGLQIKCDFCDRSQFTMYDLLISQSSIFQQLLRPSLLFNFQMVFSTSRQARHLSCHGNAVSFLTGVVTWHTVCVWPWQCFLSLWCYCMGMSLAQTWRYAGCLPAASVSYCPYVCWNLQRYPPPPKKKKKSHITAYW